MPLPEGIKGYEEDAPYPSPFEEGDRVYVQNHPSLPRRLGTVDWRRWEHGNGCWSYRIALDEEVYPGHAGTMAPEHYLTLA